MGFIEFPFIEVPEDLRKIVGEPTTGTRAYRREGTHAECGQWIEDLGLHYKGDVGISPAGVTMFVPVQRAAVHKRIKEGKLTAFFFYITRIEDTFFGNKRKVKMRPYILLSVSECKAWAAEMKRRLGYEDEPGATPMTQSERLLQAGGGGEEPKTPEEAKEVLDFAAAGYALAVGRVVCRDLVQQEGRTISEAIENRHEVGQRREDVEMEGRR